MIKHMFSNGTLMIAITSAIFVVVSSGALYVAHTLTDPSTVDGANIRFYVQLAIGLGIVVLAITQFCLNMYVANPLGSFSAAIFATIIAAMLGGILKSFVSSLYWS